MCPVCCGRGEVPAGVTTGILEKPPYIRDFKGNLVGCAEPTGYAINPAALIKKEIWLLEENPFGILWGIAICGKCRGTGFVRD